VTSATVLALLAAVCFAVGNVMQQKGTLETEAGEDDPRFLAEVVRRPVWLVGAVSQGAGWVLQAMALDRGPLALVQSLTMLSLVISLPLGVKFTNQHITRTVAIGAMAVVVGVCLFVAEGAPSNGTSQPSAAAWWAACLITLGLVVSFVGLGRRRHGAGRAALFGAAAGFSFGLQGAVTKVFVTHVGQGIGAILSSWTIYVLIICAVVGFALQQSALKTGVLAPAISSSNAVNLFMGVLLGVTVFDETLQSGTSSRASAIIGLVLALWGVVMLASGSGGGAAATDQPGQEQGRAQPTTGATAAEGTA
jgi:drug/metabolite transporter (DMT)-like permease